MSDLLDYRVIEVARPDGFDLYAVYDWGVELVASVRVVTDD